MSSVKVEPGAPMNTLAIAQIVLSSMASTCNITKLPKLPINSQIFLKNIFSKSQTTTFMLVNNATQPLFFIHRPDQTFEGDTF